MDLTRLYTAIETQGWLPPVERWNPPFCGDIDMHISHDGTWFYNGAPINRPAMVRLFAGILRREDDAYFLVTPVEKVGITVADVPFVAVEMTAENGVLAFRTNVGDQVTVDAGHRLRFEVNDDGFRPYLHVRNGLEARLTPSLARDMAALGEIREHLNASWFGISSGSLFFPVVLADHL